jgi:chitodextrinase
LALQDTTAHVYDPATNTMTAVPYGADLFCSGHGLLPDGRVFFAGGNVGNHMGLHDSTFFNPATQSWSSGAKMLYGRWYPTVTELPDGRMLVTAGETTCNECNAPIPEIYNPATNAWTQLSGALKDFPYYPHQFVLPDGRVLVSSTNRRAIASAVLDLGTQSWSTVDPRVLEGGSAAMYAPGKIIKSGLARDPDIAPANSVATTYVLDMNQPAPAWRQTASMAFPRTEHNLTLLPDGTVLAIGGSRNSDVADTPSAVLEPEMWSPSTETWTVLAAMSTPRMYHSTAVLMPDGRVLVAGGGKDDLEVDQRSAEIYSPPYLFKGTRPTITSAPATMQYGGDFFVATPDGARIASVALLGLGSVTHAFNENQRFVPLTFLPSADGLTIQAPANANLAPPGSYMLFILDTNGVPSVAPMTKINSGPPDTQPPTAPANLTATAISTSQINLAWTASTDNVAVTSYLIERCAGAGCTNFAQVGTALGPSYNDGGVTGNTTYVYRVRATDAAGNPSGYSNVASALTPAGVSGLLASYAFSEGAGTTTADASGKGHTGTISGATWTATGKYGKALSFNGSTSFVDLGNAADLQITGSMSVSAWIFATVNPADDGQIVSKSSGPGWQLKTSPDTGPHTFGVSVSPTSSSNTQRYSTTVRQLNTWYHVTGVYDAAARTLNIYVNGVLDNGVLLGTVPASQYNATQNVNIGRRGGGYYFQGTIDEVRLYNRALSQAEIQADMNTPVAAAPDTQPPSAPTSLTATAISTSQINLAWTASTDNVAVTSYLIERCAGAGCTNFAQITSVSGTTFSNTALSAGTSYSYQVRAVDAAANPSGYSNVASALTLAPDTQPPTAPTNLTATTVNSAQIDLAWTASTDDVAVTSYLIERCAGAGCSSFTQIATASGTSYSNTGLSAKTSYSYRVRATDATSNLSGYSNVATAITPSRRRV